MTLRKKSCDCGGKNSKNNLYTNTAVHSHEDQECSSVFETALGDNIPIIYCEECYKKEIL